MIDWQFTSIMPAFMQVQWPTFLSPPNNYEYCLVKPELPVNFNDMDEDEKAFARTSYVALTHINSPVRHLLSFCDNTTKNGIIPLRDSLTEIIENWTELGLVDTCPFRIDDYDLSKHQHEVARYKDWQTLKGYTQELLHTDDDGWISPQLDFDKVRARHDELFQLYMQRETEVLSEEEAKRLWFYTDKAEDGSNSTACAKSLM
ncbi:hypothetical protein BO94DRAFT_550962 [Aspergillus sclerotioniger CBS 115572]|uniref:Uncharacterized protein n=1 Tax=Aspergillus sclerotioniger CBS 115572 TaxID=1450535 RepID=A0A317V402_9EURO|nr:hypothetical protein BO94DRAFT_550962 [Aspergillus sclerotioniger CBS 115572]PWY69004.1 hypothetical protein BO94DRAFT_550962 [Aspergillus sclerotioniger CBS 115572]